MSRYPENLPRSPIIPDGLQNVARPDTASVLLVPGTDPPVERINGVWKFVRRPGGATRVYSLPGHLLHLVLRGSFVLRTLGHEFRVGAGNLLYYHETQEIEWLDISTPITFYSVSFLAPRLHPLPESGRVMKADRAVRKAFDDLFKASKATDPLERTLVTCSELYTILAHIARFQAAAPTENDEEEVWWFLERTLRQRGMFRATLSDLCGLCNKSRATVIRACRHATGTTPMQRLRAIRMNEAVGLLEYSPMNVTQVAEYLGYPRMHEFSREFAEYFDMPPSVVRRF